MICRLCPRRCGIDRSQFKGFCDSGENLRIARAAPHFWEEPCISGTKGSGAIFFSGCSLRCCFCQNREISAENQGKEISVNHLAEIFTELETQGVHNLNLVSPTHWQIQILKALSIAKPKIPVIWNSSGYELVESLKELEGYIDIFLPDLKFYDSLHSKQYAQAPDYFKYASTAILEMFRQSGVCQFDDAGILKKGTVIRHLVLPKGRQDSKLLLDWIAKALPLNQIKISLMSQYTPSPNITFPELRRRISTFEYEDVVNYALSLGLDGYMQERSAAKSEYTPPFDLTGV